MMDFAFEPDAVRAAEMDQRMHYELALSLRHIDEACFGQIDYDRAALLSLIDQLEEGRAVKPAVFGRYYQLVLAIEAARFADAAGLFGQIVIEPYAEAELEIVRLGDDRLADSHALYMSLMSAEEMISFRAPPDDVALAFTGRLRQGLALLDEALPSLAAEIRALVRQVVIAGSDPDAAQQFDGGSHYQLWGALFLNGNFHEDEVAIAEVLAHEAAHSLLFGYCIDEPLVFNPDGELYASPLRQDPRPMDGIFHAVYVSARMHYVMSALARCDRLTAAQRVRAEAAAAKDGENFYAGYEIVQAHADFSETGRAVMQAAKDYMDIATASI